MEGQHFVELQTALAGRYSLERVLGRGGMGIVYLAVRGSRARRRADISGERWLKIMRGRVGDWVFKLGGGSASRGEPPWVQARIARPRWR